MGYLRWSTGRALVALVAGLWALAGCADDDDDTGGDAGPVADAGDTDTTDDSGAEYPFDITGMEWANVPGGLDVPTADVFAGKVVLVMCFQAW